MSTRAKWKVLGLSLVAATTMLAGTAEAARIGSGRSLGVQRAAPPAVRPAPQAPAASKAAPSAQAPSSQSTKPFDGPAANPVMPRGTPAAAAPGAAAASTAAAGRTASQAGASRWLGPIAGIGAALGIAALLSHFGIAPAMSDLLALGLFALAAVMLARLLLLRRARGAQGAASVPEAAARDDAGTLFDTRFGGALSRKPAREPAAGWPPGFDAERFARQAVQQFRVVQRAYDHGDTALLADVMTPELYTEAVQELRARGLHIPTEFDTVDADVLDVATEADLYWVRVRFHGMVREDGAAAAQPFDEVWNLSKPVDGSSGWLVAGIQQSIAA